MTIDVQDVPTQRASGKRLLTGLGVGIAVLMLVAVPLRLSTFGVALGFSVPGAGPWFGALFAGIALLLLALPVVAGLLTARVLTASGWKIAFVISALGLGLMLGPISLSRVAEGRFP
jgi:hypothetical protein